MTGNSPAKQARDYQDAAFPAVLDWFEHGKGWPLVVAPTGSGKSLLIAEFIRRALEIDPTVRVIVIAHVSELLDQNAKAIQGQCPGIHLTFYNAKMKKKNMDGQVVVGSIQSIYKKAHQIQNPPADIIIIDEAHMIPHDGDGMYRRFFNDMKQINPYVKCIGYTATPFRTKGGLLHKGKGALFDGICYEIGIVDLINQGYLSPILTPTMNMKMDTSGVAVHGGDYVAKQLEQAVDTDEITQACVDEIMDYCAGRNKWLVFTTGISHCEHVRDEIRSRGIACEMLTGKTPTEERNHIIAWHKERAQEPRCLVNVSVLTTGYDNPHIDLLVFMRPTRSPVLYCLDSKTEILTSHGWKGMGQIIVGDCAPAMDMETGQGKWARVTGYIERDMQEDERWVEYNAPRANFRVTSDHNLIISTKTNKGGKSPFKIVPAITAALHANGVYMPTAVEIPQPGVPLSDAELYFIGMVLTDGSVTPNQVLLYQSERHPEIIDRIERCLNDCGFIYSKRRSIAKSEYKENYARWIFTIPLGVPRRKGRNTNTVNLETGRNCSYLRPYLDKDLSPLLLAISKQQFVILLQAIFDGDGHKKDKAPNMDYTMRSYSICSARKIAIERLQALAAIHGFTGHLRSEQCNRNNPIWILTVTPQSWRSVGGAGKRPQVTVSPATKEKVWCVETTCGTIITRRLGKVTVMGNCQMIGRAMRIAPGKHDAIVLDFGAVIETLGPIDQIRLPQKREGQEGKAPSKTCPECGEENHAAARICIQCGFEFPKAESNIDSKASEAAIISTQIKPQKVPVAAVNYYRHKKDGKPDTLRVEFRSGMLKTFNKWLCLEHSGTPRALAAIWWREASAGKNAPSKIDEALKRTSELRKPEFIYVKKVGKYFEVIGAEYEKELADTA